MAGKIFVNYRRGDEPGFALALFGQLEKMFPPEWLFMDVEGGIGAGHDFVDVLDQQVASCDVLLALIGRNWLTARDEQGRRRLDNAEDFVRIEIASALQSGKRVIPVLINDTAIPRVEDLPEPLRPLARLNARRLTQERFGADASRLIKDIESALAEADAARAQTAAERAATEQRETAEAARRTEAEKAAVAAAALQSTSGLTRVEIAKAEELANWDFIKDSRNSQEFRNHLARFPVGIWNRQAAMKLDAAVKLENLAWEKISSKNDIGALQAYVAEFPNSAHAEKAKISLWYAEHSPKQPRIREGLASFFNPTGSDDLQARLQNYSISRGIETTIGPWPVTATPLKPHWPGYSYQPQPATLSDQQSLTTPAQTVNAELNSKIQISIDRIQSACRAPALPPADYQILFAVMAQEIGDNGFIGSQTIKNTTKRAGACGLVTKPDDVRFIFEVVGEIDPWFEQGASASLFASRFRNFVVARCRSQGITLTADELDLVEAWFSSPPDRSIAR